MTEKGTGSPPDRRPAIPALLDRLVRRLVGPSPDTSSWQYLATVFGVLAVLVGGITALLRSVGLWAHRAREALVDSPALSYPEQELLFTGVQAVAQLPWRGLMALGSDHGVLRSAAWGLLLLGAVCAAGAAWLRRRRPAWWRPVVMAGASLLAILLFASVLLTTLAVRAQEVDPRGGGSAAFCAEQPGPTLPERTVFETCSWLVNESPRNAGHRESLGGLVLWLAVTTGVGAGVVIRARGSGSRWAGRWRLGLLVGYGVLALLLLRAWPEAHAYAAWGLQYPRVDLLRSEGCDPSTDLVQAVRRGSCCVYDVSETAVERALLLWGPDCPDSRGVVVSPTDDGCTVTRLGGPGVVGQECG